jgi:PAS domain S-box-containing protein
MEDSAEIITQLLTELNALRQRVTELEAKTTLQDAANAALQESLEEQGLIEEELRQALVERDIVHQEVEATHEQYQTLFELAPDGYLVTDAAGVIREANHAAARLLERRRTQLYGLPLAGFVAQDAVQTFSALLNFLGTAPLEQPREMPFHPPRGTPFVGELTVTIQPGASRTDTRYHWLLRDVTARKDAEAALQRAEHFALLGRLAAGVSHEIRNPLGAISLHVDLLAEELHAPSPDSAAQIDQSLADIKLELGRLTDLVEDYLSLVRVAAMERTPQDLGAAVHAWVTEMEAQAAARGMAVHLNGHARLGTVAFHVNTLRRAVCNLVQNALEAMPPGGTVTISGQRTATHVELHVRDTGSGIPPEALVRIFEPLYTTKPGGTGLGLYIVREVVAAHGGQVTVESVVGQGTTFTIRLPQATPGLPA